MSVIERSDKTLGSIIEHTPQLPANPQVAHRTMQLITADTVDSAELAAWLELDPALCAVVLKACAERGVFADSTYAAVVELGFEAIKEVLLGALPFTWSSTCREDRELWYHATATGVTSALIARRFCQQHQPLAYLAGLLHDVGRLALRLADRERALDAERQAGPMGLAYVERRIFGCAHSDVGAGLLRRWKLPEEVVWAALCHHDADFPSLAGEHAKLVASVILAEQVVHRVSTRDQSPDRELLGEAMRVLGISGQDLRDLNYELRREPRRRPTHVRRRHSRVAALAGGT
jgi:putative nucleotidyltransferase with HDIG domain